MKAKARLPWSQIPLGTGTARLVLLTAILLLGFALRVLRLTADRFHADEALYAGWALLIRDGDPLLLTAPVDKPPLYLYTLAGSIVAFGQSEVAARLPSLACSILGIAFLYRLGRRLYGPSRDCGSPGTLAALFLALSPFDILFARTAFTDSMLVMWMLAALWAAAAGRWFLAGISLGLAFATKQHALFLVPLVLAVGWAHTPPGRGRRGARGHWIGRATKGLPACGLGFALPLAGVVAWDSARWADRPSYWHQGASSYGGLTWAPYATWGERLIEWIGWARYLAGSRALGVLLLLALAGLLVRDWKRRPGTRQTWIDTLLAAYGLSYLVAHIVLQFSTWDRYLLPLAPLTALLAGRIVVQTRGMETAPTRDSFDHSRAFQSALDGGWSGKDAIWKSRLQSPFSNRISRSAPGDPYRSTAAFSPRSRRVRDSAGWERESRTRRTHYMGLLRVLSTSVVILFVLSAWTAAQNGYPIGGEHWAYQGLDQVAAYLQANAPPDAVLYHHWLRWHYTFYLHDTTFELRWWESGEHLRREVLRTPDRAQYIVLPDWRTLEPDVEGIAFRPVYEARRRDGSVSLSVYRVEPQQLASPVRPAGEGSE